MKELNIFYFDNYLGEFDEFNPRYVMEQKYVKKILTLISKKTPYFFSESSLEKKLNIKHQDLIKAVKMLTNISAISIKNKEYKLNFPFFNNEDVKIIKDITIKELNNSLHPINEVINSIKNELEVLYPNISPELSTYHLLCGQIFDGKMFDYLSENKMICQSFEQNKSRDYLIIGYENSNICNQFNKKLFCSFNHARCQNESLSSFGNADGERYDLFRYFKLKDINRIYGKFKILDDMIGTHSKEEIISESLKVIKSIYNNHQPSHNIYWKALITLKYINQLDEITVPVFYDYETKVNILFNKSIEGISKVLIESYNRIKKQIFATNISSIKNKIDEDAICNELWHVYFGLLNKILIDKKIVATPQQFYKQGKFLKCIYLVKPKFE